MAFQPKSSSLFHFARKLDYLKLILKNGFVPRYYLEDTSYLGIDFTAFPMTCFCDIPISRIFDHTAFYGDYGIGMTKEWGSRNRLIPLIYTPADGPVPNFINYVVESVDESQGNSPINEHFFSILPFVKPLSGKMIMNGATVDKEFSQENEWRYVPKKHKVVFEEQIKKELDSLNQSVASQKLEFLPTDVRHIFVKEDGEIPEIFDFIQTDLGQWPLNDIKILTTRITSLQTLSKDV